MSSIRRFPLVLLLLTAAISTAPAILAQSEPRRALHCAAAGCEEMAIYAAALDTVLRQLEGRGFRNVMPPRLFSTVHNSPFRTPEGLSPPVDRISYLDIGVLRRTWAGITVVDSSTVVKSDGRTLTDGGVLIILSPISWRGPDTVRVRFAKYPSRIDVGSEVFVFLHYFQERWNVLRVEYGWQN